MSEPTTLSDSPSDATVLVGYIDLATGATVWVGHECPICMKAILAEEWQEHLAWHAT